MQRCDFAIQISAYDLTMMAQEASAHGLHDAATVFLEAATKKATEEEMNKTDLVKATFIDFVLF